MPTRGGALAAIERAIERYRGVRVPAELGDGLQQLVRCRRPTRCSPARSRRRRR